MTVESNTRHATTARPNSEAIAFLVMVLVLVVAPAFVYPVSLMKALCFALFACAFNLLIGYAGLLSFGHALFFGWGAYLAFTQSDHAERQDGDEPVETRE